MPPKRNIEPLHRSPNPHGASVFEEDLDGVAAVVKEGAVGSIAAEYRVLRAVHGPGIPKVLGYEEEGSTASLAMEKLPGVGLDTFIGLERGWRSRPLHSTDAVEIVGQLAERFKSVSRGGYLYRDLNLAHVVVDEGSRGDFQVGLLDYELCVPKRGDVARIDTTKGTWETMAPEEFRRGSTMTEASNVYSLGVVLVQLTTGRNPFFVSGELAPDEEQGKGLTEFLHRRGLTFSPFEGSPMGDVISRSLAPNPEDRFQTLDEFQDALQAVVEY